VCVEPEGWDDMRRSLELGGIEPVAKDAPPTLCDALQTTLVSPITFGILKERRAHGVAVSEEGIVEAVRFAWKQHGLVVEPGGGAALAALLSGRVESADGTVAILSGGNIDPALHARIVSGDQQAAVLYSPGST
jgi:threonine dehydratase